MSTALVHFNHTESQNLTTWPDMRTSKWKPNYGDMLVCLAILKELDLGETVRVGFSGTLKRPVDRAIVRGSTYLHNEFNFDHANLTLDSIDAPLAIVGLGAQNPTQDVTFLDNNAGAKAFISRLNEKSKSISVRGDFSAAVVERLGGKNIRVTGCPSLFYLLEAPVVRVPEMLSLPERSMGVSLHTGLSANIFCNNPTRARVLHGRAINWSIRNSANCALFEQGVLREYNVADRSLTYAERHAAAVATIDALNASEFLTPELLMAHMVSVKSIEEWLAKARDLDAIIGFRFHGNMVALLQGKPCYYYVYDSRLREFCDLYGLPYQDVAQTWTHPAEAMIVHDWDRANARIAACFAEIKAFYAENGFKTRFA